MEHITRYKLFFILYGYDEIPQEWVTVIARKEDIKDLADRLQQKY
jgi:hypothetical protein